MAWMRSWRSWRWIVVVLLMVLSLTALFTPGAGIECFLCSYSPRGNSSRLDGCTDANFTEELTESRTCLLGCEAVAVYDLNGELESFHRNCATKSTIITNSCDTYENMIITRHVCSCDWSYCNHVPTLAPSRGLLVILGVLLGLVYTSSSFLLNTAAV